MAVIFGTEGDDRDSARILGTGFADDISGLGGDDQIIGGPGNDTLRGGDGNDLLDGDSGDDLLLGGAGDEVAMFGNEGNDTLNGGKGFDDAEYGSDPAPVTINLKRGFALDGYGARDTLISIEGAVGSAFSDHIIGGKGDNRLSGLAGYDTIDGGPGQRDEVGFYLAEREVIVDLAAGYAQDGYGSRDTLIRIEAASGARDHDSILRGDRKDNGLFGYDGDDELQGRGGDDFLRGRDGDNTMDGGNGRDTVSYSLETMAVTADLARGRTNRDDGGVDMLRRIENLGGSNYGDRLFGDGAANDIGAYDGDDRVEGRGGKDTLWGGRGDDTVKGGGGNDLIYSSDGSDVLMGGKGRDSLTFDSDQRSLERGQIVGIVDLAAGTLRSEGEIEVAQRAEGFENVLGTLYDFDVAVSVDLHIIGSRDKNLLVGGNGFDTIEGGKGKDTLDGAKGNDRLAGQGGNDTLTGGGGTDRFVFTGDWGTDTVTDFNRKGRVERLEISGADEAGSIRAFKRASTMEDGDLVYDAGDDGENVIVLEGIRISELRANDIDFV